MIDTKELRIGNIVAECPFVEESHRQHKVEGISKEWNVQTKEWDGFVHFDNGDIWEEKQTEPIPLTEDWIKKFGFENSKTQDKFFTKDNSIGISTADDKFCFIKGNFVCQIVLRDIEFVHQLQNLYHSVTGTDLTVGE